MEKISALMDGELKEEVADEQISLVKQNIEKMDHWHLYHLIGDTLRHESALGQSHAKVSIQPVSQYSPSPSPSSSDASPLFSQQRLPHSNFNQRLRARLAAEPTILSPHPVRQKTIERLGISWLAPFFRKSAFNNYLLAAAASVTAVAMVSWAVLELEAGPRPAVSLAKKAIDKTVPMNERQAVIGVSAKALTAPSVEDPGSQYLQEYLLAHQGLSPSTAIQGVAAYVRSVSFQGD